MRFVTFKEFKRRAKKGLGVSLVAFGSAIIGSIIKVNQDIGKFRTIALLVFIFLIVTVGVLISED